MNSNTSAFDVSCQCGEVYHAEQTHIGSHIRCRKCSQLLELRAEQSTPQAVSTSRASSLSYAGWRRRFRASSTYNSRLQPTVLSAIGKDGLGLSATLMSRSYDFVGNVTDDGETGNNGNVYAIADNLDGPADRPIGSAKFRYDKLNRLTQAKSTGTDCASLSGKKNWGNTYSLDAWSNLTASPALPGYISCADERIGPNSVGINNRFSSSTAQYDAAGNMTGYFDQTSWKYFNYDAESRITNAVGGPTYTYDGDGNRVAKSGSTLYWRGTGLEELAESDASGNLTSEYIYFGGKRVARIELATPTLPVFYISDHLGSATVLANLDGTRKSETLYFPYGGERWTTGTDANHYKFTGKERDTETGLDYFGARYYGSNMGRFLSPDWAANPTAVPYADFGDPQTLNLYGYVRNNPLSKADPDGHLGCGFLWLGKCPDPPPPPPPPKANIPPAPFLKPNPLFKTADAAAKAGAKAINPTSQKKGVEYGGRPFKIKNGLYSYTGPFTDNKPNSVNVDAGVTGTGTNPPPYKTPTVPLGTESAGEYHTHPAVPGYQSDRFSFDDVDSAWLQKTPAYVARPDNSVIKYDPQTGKQTVMDDNDE